MTIENPSGDPSLGPARDPAAAHFADQPDKASVQADYFQGRIDLKAFRSAHPEYKTHSSDPLVIEPAPGCFAAMTKFGGLVCWNCPPDLRERLQRLIVELPGAGQRVGELSDEIEVVTGQPSDTIEFERVTVRRLSLDAVKVVSTALAQSVALEYFENQVGEALRAAEPIVMRLRKEGGLHRSERRIIKAIGFALEIRSEVLANLTLFDSPPEAWESATIARLVSRLYDYFDLEERLSAIKEKVSYLSDLNSTLLNLLSNRKSRGLEWIVIILIAVETLIFVYAEMARLH